MVVHAFVPSAGAGTALTLAFLKLIDVVDEENTVLRQNKIGVHAGFTDRKNQALRELMAAQRSTPPHGNQKSWEPLLRQLSSALQENSRLLKLNIAAVGEISDIIIAGLREAESDGTYGRVHLSARW